MRSVASRESVIVFRDETDNRIELSGQELLHQIAVTAEGLRRAGVVPGDRVAGFVPNHPATLVAMLATASIGAVWSSCSPDFGISGVLDRFGQTQPKVLFAANGYRYNGKSFDCLERVKEIANKLDSIELTVVFDNIETNPFEGNIDGMVRLADFQVESADLRFEQLPFDHPLFILYTSGTTGVPKCIVHRAGGALVQLMKDHRLHCDLSQDDTLFFFSTCGWMMWNWLVTALASGSRLVLYDGTPIPTRQPDLLWQIAAEEGVTAFGAGARYYGSIQKMGVKPRQAFDLSRIRLVMSTGSVLTPESYDYIYKDISQDALLASVTGGTDILSAFALGVPTLPLYRGEIQCRALGMAVDVVDEAGNFVAAEKGELVCKQPFPSMPLCFWNDDNNKRYDDAYFSKLDGVWNHGDFAELTPRGGMIVHGRSDAVLNPGGVRIGTAEIYRQVEQIEEVLDSVCVGQQWDDDVRVILFVVLKDALILDDDLRAKIRHCIKENATPRHVPAVILQVNDVPRTMSGKVAEIAVRDAVNDIAIVNKDALENPQALSQFNRRRELQGFQQ